MQVRVCVLLCVYPGESVGVGNSSGDGTLSSSEAGFWVTSCRLVAVGLGDGEPNAGVPGELRLLIRRLLFRRSRRLLPRLDPTSHHTSHQRAGREKEAERWSGKHAGQLQLASWMY